MALDVMKPQCRKLRAGRTKLCCVMRSSPAFEQAPVVSPKSPDRRRRVRNTEKRSCIRVRAEMYAREHTALDLYSRSLFAL